MRMTFITSGIKNVCHRDFLCYSNTAIKHVYHKDNVFFQVTWGVGPEASVSEPARDREHERTTNKKSSEGSRDLKSLEGLNDFRPAWKPKTLL